MRITARLLYYMQPLRGCRAVGWEYLYTSYIWEGVSDDVNGSLGEAGSQKPHVERCGTWGIDRAQ